MGKEKETLKKLSTKQLEDDFFTATNKDLTQTQEIKINVKNSKLLSFMANNQAGKKKKKSYDSLPTNIVRFNPDVTKGLTSDQVEQRKREELTNVTKDVTARTYKEIFFYNIFNFLNVTVFSIAIALIVFKQYTQTFFALIAMANTAISIFQEIKSKKIVANLKLVTSQNVNVLRDGNIITIPAHELVLDDVFVLNNGDQIPTDAIILSGECEVNESLLTGESMPIKKGKHTTIYAGSFLVSGSIIVKAIAIGSYNYALGIQAKAKEYKMTTSELVSSLNKVIKTIGIIIFPLGISLFFTQLFLSNDIAKVPDLYKRVSDSFSYTAGALIGMIPSGMYLLTSVALSSGVISLSKKKTLVQDIYCIEMLARTTTLCLDKTGTLTDGTMHCSNTIVYDKKYNMKELVGSYLGAFNESNSTSIALSRAYPISKEYAIKNSMPFSSERKYSAVSFEKYGMFLLGAPEFVYTTSTNKKDKLYKEISEEIKLQQQKGFRVVMLVRVNGKESKKDKLITSPVALFVIEDHIRPEAKDTINWFVKNNVKIKIISGDNPLTASEIAKKCGVPNAEKAISLEGLTVNQLASLVKEYTVFGRVTPEQKAAIIKELKNNGETVAMTGDGVNDILAMKNSDCSIAMANGASSAKNVAHLVLLDSNFSHMPEIVAEGRRVINNIQRSSSLFLMKTIFSIALTIFVLITFIPAPHNGITYPFQTYNFFIMEVAGIGLPSVLLALQKNNAEIKGHFVRNTLSRAIPGAFCMLLVISLAFLFRSTNLLGLEEAKVSTWALAQGRGEYIKSIIDESFTTFCSLSLATISLAMVFNCSIPFNKYRMAVYILSLSLACVGIFAMPYIQPLLVRENSHALAKGIEINLSTQLTGTDFRYLSVNEMVILFLYFIIGTPVLTMLISLFGFMREEKLKLPVIFDNSKQRPSKDTIKGDVLKD